MAKFWLLAAVATAAFAKDPCEASTALKFRLVANVTCGASNFHPSIQNWAVSAYHIGACLDIATLRPKSEGIEFYANGTKAQVTAGEGDVLTTGGTPAIPYGFIINNVHDDINHGHAVEVNCGYGTSGVGISQSAKSLHHLVYNDAASGEG